jgi:hypothetical protein
VFSSSYDGEIEVHVIDESGEREAAQADGSAAHRVNWFRTERPVAGTTFRRPPLPEPTRAGGAEDTTPR